MLRKILNLSKKYRTKVSFILGIFRYFYFRLYGKKIFTQNAKIYGLKNIHTGGILQVGLFKNGLVDESDRSLLRVSGKLLINSDVQFAAGCRVFIGKDAVVTIGNSYFNIFTRICILHGLTIGDNCAISWDVEFLDDDFHEICYEGRRLREKHIYVGDKVWIGSGVKVLKGSVIPSGCVVASNSVICSVFSEENCLLGGNPAKIIKSNITWNK